MAYSIEKSQKGGAIMNVKLRKRHRYIWMVLGIALPLLCLEAIENIPTNVIADIPRHSCTLGIGICGIDDTDAKASITSTANLEQSSISVSVNGPLKSAFTLVYLSSDQEINDNAVLLGSIEGMGDYNFDLPKDNMHGSDPYLVIVDQLNANTLYHQQFNNSGE